MKVLFLTPAYPSRELPVAGIFIRKIAEALQRTGVEVTVVHPVPAMPLPRCLLPLQWQRWKDMPELDVAPSGVRVLRPRYVSYPRSTLWGGAHLLISRATRKLIEKYNVRADVLHAHWGYPMGQVALMLGREMGAPVVCTVRGGDINVLPRRSWLYRLRIGRVLREVDLVTSVSAALAGKATALGAREVRVIYNGVELDAPELVPDRHTARRSLGLAPDAFYVLYVGALTRPKGVRELFQVIETNIDDSLRFIIIGDKLGMRESIVIPPGCRFEGPQPNDLVHQYMAASDMLILPSYREGMPNVVVEAGALGLPVAVTPVGGVPELVDESCGFLFEPRSTESIRAAITSVRSDPKGAVERAARLRTRVLHSFDINANARLLSAAYAEILSARGQAHVGSPG